MQPCSLHQSSKNLDPPRNPYEDSPYKDTVVLHTKQPALQKPCAEGPVGESLLQRHSPDLKTKDPIITQTRSKVSCYCRGTCAVTFASFVKTHPKSSDFVQQSLLQKDKAQTKTTLIPITQPSKMTPRFEKRQRAKVKEMPLGKRKLLKETTPFASTEPCHDPEPFESPILLSRAVARPQRPPPPQKAKPERNKTKSHRKHL
eukprot:1855190-Amphidinium_carterae.1